MIYTLRPHQVFAGTVPIGGGTNIDIMTEEQILTRESLAFFRGGEAINILSVGISGSSFLLLLHDNLNGENTPSYIEIEACHEGGAVRKVTTPIALMGSNGEIAMGEVYNPNLYGDITPYFLRISAVISWDTTPASLSISGKSYKWVPIIKVMTTRQIGSVIP
jgi:hypothetical protein